MFGPSFGVFAAIGIFWWIIIIIFLLLAFIMFVPFIGKFFIWFFNLIISMISIPFKMLNKGTQGLQKSGKNLRGRFK